jgi:hypothetical protein
MRWHLSVLGLCVCLAAAPCVVAADEKQENPLKNAKVGDWASYKMAQEAGGKTFDLKLKMTVTAKDDKEAKLQTTATLNNMELPGQETKIDLTKPYDPTSVANIPKEADAKVKVQDEGKETLTVGKTKYECKWTSMKVTAKVQNMDFESEVKVWMSKDAPLTGLVKMEMKSSVTNVTMMLEDSGKGK